MGMTDQLNIFTNDTVLLEFRQFAAPFLGRGYVRFINFRPDKHQQNWACDECMKIIRPSNMKQHARDHR